MEIKHQEDIITLIAKNLAGLANESEIVRLSEGLENSTANRQYFEQVKNIWDVSDKKIDPHKINTAVAVEKILTRIQEGSAGKTFWHYWQKIAAIIILPLAIGSLFWIYINGKNTKSIEKLVYNEVHTSFGIRSSLRLSDSTLVWLNSGSSLRYPVKFKTKNRTVFLKGEAYFEVESDAARPFIVQTSTLNKLRP